jgi:hypothetical protein
MKSINSQYHPIKLKNVIIKILQEAGTLTKFHLVKLVYLYDLAHVQLFGKSGTCLPYIWHQQGPYCDELEAGIWDLETDNLIKVNNHTTRAGYECFIHVSITKEEPKLKKTDKKIIAYIVDKYANLKYMELRDFVYSTPPMIEAKKGERFERIKMETKSNTTKQLYDKETVEMILESEKIDRSEYIPLDEAMKEFEEAFSE